MDWDAVGEDDPLGEVCRAEHNEMQRLRQLRRERLARRPQVFADRRLGFPLRFWNLPCMIFVSPKAGQRTPTHTRMQCALNLDELLNIDPAGRGFYTGWFDLRNVRSGQIRLTLQWDPPGVGNTIDPEDVYGERMPSVSPCILHYERWRTKGLGTCARARLRAATTREGGFLT